MHVFGAVLLMSGVGIAAGGFAGWARADSWSNDDVDHGSHGISAPALSSFARFAKWSAVVGVPAGVLGLSILLLTR